MVLYVPQQAAVFRVWIAEFLAGLLDDGVDQVQAFAGDRGQQMVVDLEIEPPGEPSVPRATTEDVSGLAHTW